MSDKETADLNATNNVISEIRRLAMDEGTSSQYLFAIQKIARTTQEIATARQIGGVIADILMDNPWLESTVIRLSFEYDSGDDGNPYRSFWADIDEKLTIGNLNNATLENVGKKFDQMAKDAERIGEELMDGAYSEIYQDGALIFDLLSNGNRYQDKVEIAINRQSLKSAIPADEEETKQWMRADRKIDTLSIFATTFPERYKDLMDDLYPEVNFMQQNRPKE